jgi:hypothetical protein
MTISRLLGFSALLSVTLAACQSPEGPNAQSTAIEAPITYTEPLQLSADDEDMLAYLHSIRGEFEQISRIISPLNCLDVPAKFDARYDCFVLERKPGNPSRFNSIADPLDLKVVLDSYADVGSIGLVDYGLTPGNNNELWFRTAKSSGGASPIQRKLNQYPYIRVPVAEFKGVEIVPLVPVSIFGYRPSTERKFIVHLTVPEQLAGVRSCYQSKVPGTLRAYDASISDSVLRPRFKGVSLSCSTTDL